MEEIETIEDVEKYVEQEAKVENRPCSGTWCLACTNDGVC